MTKTITEAEFPAYLQTIDTDRWKKLFDLIPEIRKTKVFGKMDATETISQDVLVLPAYQHAEIITRFIEIVYDLGIIISFDWPGWQEGSKLLSDPSSYFEDMDNVTLCKLLTTIVRADRFNDGFLIINFSDGTVLKILEALRNSIKGKN